MTEINELQSPTSPSKRNISPRANLRILDVKAE